LGVKKWHLFSRDQKGAVWGGFRKRIFTAFLKFRSALMMSITHFLKDLFRGPAARTAAESSQECACSLQNKAVDSLYLSAHSIPRSAFMMIISALLRLISAGKNGKNVFISAKSSVVSKRAYESHKRAYEHQKHASQTYKRRKKREKRVHKRQKQCCFQARF